MRSPINTTYRLTSPYGMRTLSGVTKMHDGVDLVPKNGVQPCEIFAPCDGIVADVRNTIPDSHTGLKVTAYVTGNYVNITADNGYTFIFRHLKCGSVKVAKGQRVKAGTQIGTMGSTGCSSGVHLHYQINDPNGRSLDPLPYVGTVKELPLPTPAPATTQTIAVGSRVKLKAGAKTYTGGGIASFVFADTWFVSALKGDRAVIDKNVSGKNSICTPVNVKDLIVV